MLFDYVLVIPFKLVFAKCIFLQTFLFAHAAPRIMPPFQTGDKFYNYMARPLMQSKPQ